MANETVSIRIKAFDQTQKALRGIQAAFGRLSKVFFSFKTALVSAVGAGGMGLLISSSLKATDALAKTAGRIGTTTEALSKLQFAGSLAGIETNTLNMALQRFVRRTAEAAQGTGEAVSALRELGVDARRIEQLPLDERMQSLASAFNRVDEEGNAVFTETEKLRLAFKLFDSEGTSMLNMLSANADEMGALFKEAKQLGLVMSTDAAKGVQDANDAFTKLRSIFEGVVRQMTAGMAPALELIATRFKEYILQQSEAHGGIENFGRYLAGELIENIRTALIGLQGITNAGIEIINTFSRARRSLAETFNVGKADPNDIRALQTEIDQIDQMLEGGFTGMLNRVRIGGDGQILQILTEDELREERARIVTRLNELGAEVPALLEPVDWSKWLIKPLQDAADEVKKPIQSVKDELEEVVVIAQEPWYMPMITGLRNVAEAIKNVIQQMPSIEQAVQSFTKNAMQTFTNQFTAAVTGAQKFSDAMKSMAKSVVDSLIKMLVQYYITKPLFDAISGGISSGFGAGGGGGGGGGGGMGMQGLARGGVATGGTPYLVGEKGPEIFVPSTTGRVVPNDQLGGGGVTVVQNINVTTGVQQTVRAEIANLLPQISNAAKSAVADARMRGGGFSKAMVGA
jgi:hypothetical protein